MDLKPHADTMSLDGLSHGAAFRRLDGARLRQVLYVTLFPNLLMSLHPDYLLVHRLTPLAPDRTHVECTWLFAPEAAEMNDFDPSYAVEFWDVTNREDWAACEAVNRGLRNRGYHPGPLSSREGTVYQWLGLLARSYLGDGFVVPQVPDSAPRGSVSTAGRTAGDVG
jgi:Rieske 2Fe-2S family protein